MTMDIASDEAAPATITARLLAVNWPLLALVTAISGFGVAVLYSVAGGSFTPYADRHLLRLLVEKLVPEWKYSTAVAVGSAAWPAAPQHPITATHAALPNGCICNLPGCGPL